MKWPRNAQRWLPGLIRARAARRFDPVPSGATIDILFCLVDHFEPHNGGADRRTRIARVRRWVDGYPRFAEGLRDGSGRRPCHSWFFPAEVYDAELVAPLAELCHEGWGECEVHLHHDADTGAKLRGTLEHFTGTLADRHGLLSRDRNGRLAYGFIHGNWALDNSHPAGRDCGVDDEITILQQTGCYADFTMPSVLFASQPHIVNRLYFAIDDPLRAASHLEGPIARAGTAAPVDGLLMIQGPLALDWRRRIRAVLPRIDAGAIDYRTPPSFERFARWVGAGVGVAGRPEWRFVKVHTHGAPERNAEVLLGGPARAMLEEALAQLNDGRRVRLHFVTAREMANVALAAVDGRSGNAADFRDYRYVPITTGRANGRAAP